MRLVNGCPCYLCKRRRRGKALKTTTVVAVGLAVASAPFWGLVTFLYVCAFVCLVVGCIALGIVLDFWKGFRAFDAWTALEARRMRDEARYPRLVDRR